MCTGEWSENSDRWLETTYERGGWGPSEVLPSSWRTYSRNYLWTRSQGTEWCRMVASCQAVLLDWTRSAFDFPLLTLLTFNWIVTLILTLSSLIFVLSILLLPCQILPELNQSDLVESRVYLTQSYFLIQSSMLSNLALHNFTVLNLTLIRIQFYFTQSYLNLTCLVQPEIYLV